MQTEEPPAKRRRALHVVPTNVLLKNRGSRATANKKRQGRIPSKVKSPRVNPGTVVLAPTTTAGPTYYPTAFLPPQPQTNNTEVEHQRELRRMDQQHHENTLALIRQSEQEKLDLGSKRWKLFSRAINSP